MLRGQKNLPLLVGALVAVAGGCWIGPLSTWPQPNTVLPVLTQSGNPRARTAWTFTIVNDNDEALLPSCRMDNLDNDFRSWVVVPRPEIAANSSRAETISGLDPETTYDFICVFRRGFTTNTDASNTIVATTLGNPQPTSH